MYRVILGKSARSAESRLHLELSQSQVTKHITMTPPEIGRYRDYMHSHLMIDRSDLHPLSSTSRSVHGKKHEKEHIHISLNKEPG